MDTAPISAGPALIGSDPGNDLLDALSPTERSFVFPHLQRVALTSGKVLCESGSALSHVFFPIDCVVSLLYVLEDGSSAEIAVVGHEGMVGITTFMGGETSPKRAVVQSSGTAFRLPAPVLKAAFRRNSDVQLSMLRYTQALITQMAQTAVCNRYHSLDQQLCRWLLLTLDRLETNVLTMTQQMIAIMLGVRREGVTDAAQKLQRQNIIRYVRGRITVLDRKGLEAQSCECYRVVRREMDRLQALPMSKAVAE